MSSKGVNAYAGSIACGVCGRYTIIRDTKDKERFWETHLNYRNHVRELHKSEKTDLFGHEIIRGYGWTDQYVYVNLYPTEDGVKAFEEEMLKLVEDDPDRRPDHE